MLTLTPKTDTNLADALRAEGLPLKMSCGGNGSCKTCRVVLDGDAVLACQTDVGAGCYEVNVGAHALQPESFQLDSNLILDLEKLTGARRYEAVNVALPSPDDLPGVSDVDRLRMALDRPGIAIDPALITDMAKEPLSGRASVAIFDDTVIGVSDQADRHAVLGIDIGTTTVACALLDAETGDVLAQAGKANAQYNHAEDLAARISFCTDHRKLMEMRTLILRDTLIPLAKDVLAEADFAAGKVLTCVVSGNAPMIHILLGLDPTSMGGYPFNGVDFAPAAREARKFGLPGRTVEFVPAHSAYFGGDVVGGLWLNSFAEANNATLFLDLGTNAEMALRHDGQMLATAAPAGPAFEGGGLAWGIGGVDGAIDHVWEDGAGVSFSTIAGKAARGICGSGVISFVAAAFRAGRLSKAGRFRNGPEIGTIGFAGKTLKAWFLTDEIYVTEEDISKFLQAKAAVFSAIHSLCRKAGLHPGELASIRIAGNFGRYFKVEDAIEIGLLPEMDPARIEIIGNSSLAGACRRAFDRSSARDQARLVEELSFVDLNGMETFQDDFIDALFLPHRSKELFPSAAEARKGRRRERHRAA